MTAELKAAPAVVRALLADPAAWQTLLRGAERLGHYWRYGGELYEARAEDQGERLIWHITCAAAPATWLHIEVRMRGVAAVTVVETAITLSMPLSLPALVGRRALRRRLVHGYREVQRAAQALLQPSGPDKPGGGRAGLTLATNPAARPTLDGTATSIAGGHPLPLSALADRYPRAVAAFAAMGALDHLDRIIRLDSVWQAIRRGGGIARHPADARDQERVYLQSPLQHLPMGSDYDLIYAGGGLSLLHAAVMARRYGYRVLLFDRGEVGCAHREWNISRSELAALVEVGFCGWDELRDVIMATYDRGVVRFYGGARGRSAELWMTDVLDTALDAGALLRLARRKLEAAGGVVLDGRAFRRILVDDIGPPRVLVEVDREDGGAERYAGRLLLDGMGSTSPLALCRFAGQPFAGVCPTVGTVATGFATGTTPDTHNPRVGDILISVADMQRGQQYLWEGFPGRGDELTVYLFYYDTLGAGSQTESNRPRSALVAQHASPSLLQLFEDYFTLLPTYKQPGAALRHIKPVYGYIPARHSVRRQEAPLMRGVLPIGDSAAQQSPLTFCGFGSHVRNLDRTTALLHAALCRGLVEPRHLRLISAYQVNASLNWVFSRFMQPWGAPDDVNALQNVFLRVLNDLGEDLARRFFRDQMRWGDYHRMVLGMFHRYPRIILIAWRVLGPAGVRRWVCDYLVYCRAALLARLARQLGARRWTALLALLGSLAPTLEFHARARFAEWRAMGWIEPSCAGSDRVL